MPISQPLTDLEERLIEFAGSRWRSEGSKQAAIRELFGMSGTEYYQAVNGLLYRPEALAFAPVTVNRLLRLRDDRRLARSVRSVTAPDSI